MPDVLLITPPFTQLNTPYPATAYLKGYFDHIGVESHQCDLSIELFNEVFSSQFIDTLTVLTLLCSFGVLPWNLFKTLLISGFLFKVIIALLDTPILYFVVYLFKKRFHLKVGEEIQLFD